MNLAKKTFIVSCQALPGEPMYGRGVPIKMVRAAVKGGATAVRVSQLSNVFRLKEEMNIPFIALVKRKYKDSEVYITPTLRELKSLIDSKAPIIAMDATHRKRPKETLEELVRYFGMNKVKNQELMADCATLEDVKRADLLGFDYIGTTMRGHSEETKDMSNVEGNFEFLRAARKATKAFLVAEGGINSPEMARKAMKIADAVVVGSAITRPDYITAMYVRHLKGG